MTKRFVALLGITILVLSLRTGAVAQNAIDVNGSWSMTSSGEAFANGQVKVRQDGSAVAGTYGQNGHFEGKFQPGTLKVDANWSDSRGTGWMTIVFAAGGKSFSGQWGRPGSNPSGHFEAVRFAYPNVSGLYYVNVTGGTDLTARRISLHQLGLDVVGNLGPGTQIDGTIASDTNALTGNWKEPNGSGRIKLQFADDGKSLRARGAWRPARKLPDRSTAALLTPRSSTSMVSGRSRPAAGRFPATFCSSSNRDRRLPAASRMGACRAR